MASQPPGAPPDGESLRQLAEQKETEWRQLQQLRLSSLEAALTEREKELAEERARFSKLKEDFKYNLKLLNDRTTELENYDTVVAELKSTLTIRDGQLSELKIELDSKETALVREMKARDDVQRHYQHRIHEKQAEMDRFRHDKEAEVNKERNELEALKRNLQRQLHETEEELDLQKHELTTGFEEAMRKREHEYRVKMDEMSSTVLAHELKVKLLTKELEVAQAVRQRVSEEAQQTEEGQRNLSKQIKQLEWQLEDVAAMKDARISELDSKVHQAQSSMKRMQDEYKRKHEELDRYAKEKQMALMKAKEAAQEQQQKMMNSIRDLQSQLEDAQVKARQLEWNRDDALKDKDAALERLQEVVVDLQGQLASQVQELSRDTVTRDLEYQTLRDNESKLKTELQQCKQDIGRYKKELVLSSEREASLERAKAQLELDWQRRLEEKEHNQYEHSEDLIKRLTQARDQALADLKEVRRHHEHQADLVSVLTKDRDQALATLKQHGLVPDKNVSIAVLKDMPLSESDELAQLALQNENLREVIRQMRQQMEMLDNQMPSSKPINSAKTSVVDEYVKNLEQEVLKLKTQCRHLEKQKDDRTTRLESSTEAAVEVASDNPIVKTHIQTLNDTIGSLRREKVELVTQVRKQQARIHHLEARVNDLTKQPQQQQVQLEQLQYELGAQTRRHQAEGASLRQRVADLELQLAETRKEADEYHRANIENNLHCTALGNELSTLKMELAEKRPPVTFGAQELMIQQLQDEIQHLQKQLTAPGQKEPYRAMDPPLKPHPSTANPTVNHLQEKLRQAARHISQLAREKQQLIEVGNRLRAELKKNGLQAPAVARPSVPVAAPTPGISNVHATDHNLGKITSGSLREQVQSKLHELEHLQYEITKQQLALTDKVSPRRAPAVEVVSSTDSQDSDDHRPQSILKKNTPSVSLHPQLSPVPEDGPISSRRPAPGSGSFPQPSVSMADTLPSRPSTAQSDRSGRYGGSPSRSREEALLLSLSSVGGESLADVWKLLDEDGISPRPFTPFSTGDGPFQGLQYPGDYASGRPRSADKAQIQSKETNSWTILGKRAEPRPKSGPQSSKLSPRTAGKPTKASNIQKPKIRNYNMKDT